MPIQHNTTEEKRTEHALTLGVDEAKIRTYKVSLQWMLEHGTLVNVQVNGISLFNTPTSLAELGINTNDVRAKRLKPGRRELFSTHLTAHHVHIEENTIFLGFSPTLPPPPAFYCRKSSRITAISALLNGEWQIITVPTVENQDDASRWVALPDVESWYPETSHGELAYWLKLDMTPGRKPVIEEDLLCNPANALRSLETRARDSIDMRKGGFGQKFPGFGGFAWIGFKAWGQWQQKWAALETELSTIKAYILWRYDEFVNEAEFDFRNMAEEAWTAMAARHPGQFAYLAPGRDPIDTPDLFQTFIVNKATSDLPSPETILSRVRIDYTVSMALGQETVAADKLAAEKLQTRSEKERAKQQVAWEKATAKQRLIREEEALAQARINAERDTVETQRLAMQKVAMEKAREQMTTMANPYQCMLDNLRAEMFASAQDIAASLKKHGGLRGNVAERARNLVNYCQVMNSHDDAKLEALLAQLNSQIPHAGGTSKEATDQNTVIEATLNEIITLTREAAQSVKERESDVYGFTNLEF